MKNNDSSRRVRTPTIYQSEAAECGAVCLAIVLGFYGRWVTPNEMRFACGVSRDGVRASDLIAAGRRYGLTVLGFRVSLRGLSSMGVPLILHWDFNHFVVLEGVSKKGLHLNDPSQGKYTVSTEEAHRRFTGVALRCTPDEDFRLHGAAPSTLHTVFKYMGVHRAPLALTIFFGVGLIVPRVARPLLFASFMGDVLSGSSTARSLRSVLLMGLTSTYAGLYTWLYLERVASVNIRIVKLETERLVRHILDLPLTFFLRRFTGDIVSRLSHVWEVSEVLSRDITLSFSNLVLSLVVSGVMLFYNPFLAAITISSALVVVMVLIRVSNTRACGYRRLSQHENNLQVAVMAGLQMVDTIKASGAERDFITRLMGHQAKCLDTEQETNMTSARLEAATPLLYSLGSAFILTVGSLQVLHGSESLGSLVGFNVLVAMLFAPLSRIIEAGGRLQMLGSNLSRLNDVLEYPRQAATAWDNPPRDTPIRLEGRVDIVDVHFRFTSQQEMLIREVSFSVQAGQWIAVTGMSGAGKSTFLRLLAGTLTPTAGTIAFDGRHREAYSADCLAHAIGVVEQEPILFSDTVRNNLTLWDSSVPLAVIRAAAMDAGIDDDIMWRPGAYDAYLQQDGLDWSGGQRQRLEIARALVPSPAILLLDEATSQVDGPGEAYIYKRIRRRGCTCIFIAHRLQTIMRADHAVFLDGGVIAAQGPPMQLLNESQRFREVVLQCDHANHQGLSFGPSSGREDALWQTTLL